MIDPGYLSALNDAQREAVEYLGGPELVIAGAGSGKTRVLTYKIVHLLAQGHDPRRILALTFTNKAAREMRERIEALVGPEVASKLWMGTFHSIFSRILRMNADRIGFRRTYTVYDTSDSKSLVKTIIKDMGLDEKLYRPGTVLGDISMAKNALYSPEDYALDKALMESDRAAKRPRTVDVYKAYRDRCHIADAMDFDDLLYYTNVLLRDNPDVLENLQDYFSYVLVDEYQDTNFAQHVIVRQLCGKKQNLCVVGDDAQSIYSFRGANIRNILDLRKTFPSLATYKLEQNYRSTRNIIGAANALIACNKEQIHKEVFSQNDEGQRIEVVGCENDYMEGYAVANRLSQVRMRSHSPLSEFAILYRTNAQSRVLEESLRNRNIPYRIYGGLAFYQRAEVKDVISYFRLAVNPDDDEALRRVINKPARGIGETTLKKLTAAAIGAGVSIWTVMCEPQTYHLAVNSGTLKKIGLFVDLINKFRVADASGVTAPELAREIIRETGMLQMYLSDNTPENISRRDNVLELIKAVDEFMDKRRELAEDSKPVMGEFLAEVSLLTDQDTENADRDCVTLMTIHAAKGLEFDNVFVVGVEEELLPSSMCRGPQDVEEERRLMYVAITRARNFCMLSFARQRMVNGMTRQSTPSRFISEIDLRYIQPVAGTRLPSSSPRRRPAAADYGGKAPSSLSHPNQPIRHSESTPVQSTTGVAIHSSAELSTGMRIEHPRFGCGTITSINTDDVDHKIIVRFATGEERKLLLKFARFRIL